VTARHNNVIPSSIVDEIKTEAVQLMHLKTIYYTSVTLWVYV